jgi:hypothetical protein
MKKDTELRPALTLPEKIQIILDSCMPNRDKIDCIMVLLETEIAEKDICLNWPKIRQQLMSEILYLFQEIEKNQELKNNRGYIFRRVNLAWTNCRESGWAIPRDSQERKCDYLENLLKKQMVMTEILTKKKAEEKKEENKQKRNAGWHSRTWDRYNKFYFGITVKAKKQPAPKRNRLPFISATTETEERR